MTWVLLVAALLGAVLGFVGVKLAPRWLEKPPKPWEAYVVAILNAVLVGWLAYKRGSLDTFFWQHALFISLLVTASVADLHEKIIPNELVLFGLGAGLLFLVIPYPGKTWSDTLIGGASGFGLLLLLAIVARGGMGMGDVKLAAVIGLFLGYPWVFMALILAFLVGGVVGVSLLVFRIVGRKDMIPFGPYLAVGAIVTALYGAEILCWYNPWYNACY